MAKIVIDAREINSSTGVYIRNLIKNLELIDSKNSYVVLVYPKDLEVWKPTNKNFEIQTTPYKEFTFGEQIGFLQQLKSLSPDLIHFGMVQQPVLYRGKVVTTMHDLITTRFRNPTKNAVIFFVKQMVYKWVNRTVARKSNVIITPSEFVKEDVAKYARINSRKIVVTHEAGERIGTKAEPVPELEGKEFIFYIGRMMPHKNLVRLVVAFTKLKNKHPKLLLVLAGKKDGVQKLVADFVESSGAKNVIFPGYIPEAQLKWMYQNTKAYVLASLSEGFGNPGIEAMLEGAPVVSSNSSCLPEVYGSAAQFFDPLNTDEMATKIDEVISSKSLREQLIKKGHAQAGKYSWKRMAEQTLEVYKSVLENS